MVLGADALGHLPRVVELVAVALVVAFVADRERLHRPVSPSEKRAAFVLESMPPERNTPTGTSLTLR